MKKKSKVAGPSKDLYRQSACQANQLAADIFTAAHTQKSKELLIALCDGDYSTIVSASVNPLDYVRGDTPNVDMFKRDYLCVELMSKFPNWDLGIDRSHVARKKFSEVEESLAKVDLTRNDRVVAGHKSATMHAVVSTARRKIDRILGELNLNEVHSFFAFGPGASTSKSRRCSDAAYKFGAQRPQLSYNALPLADALSKAHPTWRFNADVVAGSKLITVPKNAKTDRTICIEPDLNMYFQKGIGRVIRKRLQRWGLLKPDAQQYNAELAREGSAYGRLATVDLSSASDSIHMGLVGYLLQPAWCDLIELTRSPCVVLPEGEVHLLRKVSSMGNGYTFELETLIFYSLCLAVIELFANDEMDHRCTVFGDDIIIDRQLVQPLEDVLRNLGFVMNHKKTHMSGFFRESCGKHYFAGTDVTPFYIRSPIDTVLRKYWAANTVRRYSRLPWGLDSTFEPTYRRLVDSIPVYYQGFKIPDGYGDGGLIADWDEVRPSRSKRGLDSWTYTDIVPSYRKRKLEGQGVLLKSLHHLEFPRGNPDVDTDTVAQITAVTLMHARELKMGFIHGYSVDEANQQLLDVICQWDGLGESDLTALPLFDRWKEHVGSAQRWPSFGPWV